MARPAPSKRGQLHSGRYFGFLAAVLLLLYLAVALLGPGSAWLRPKLGLDLKGGATVILTPKAEGGKKVSANQLSTAVEIIRRRVDSAGVSEAEVVTEGDVIVVSVPGGNRASIANVTKTAQLNFREVIGSPQPSGVTATLPTPAPSGAAGASAGPKASGPPAASPAPTSAAPSSAAPSSAGASAPSAPGASPTSPVNRRPLAAGLLAAPSASPAPSPAPTVQRPIATAAATAGSPAAATDLVVSGAVYTPAAYAALDCSNPKARQGGADPVPTKEIVACDAFSPIKYHLAVAKVVGTDVKGANVGNDQTTGAPNVNIQFTGKGQNRWTTLTEKTVGKQVGVVLDGVVVSAPTIQTVINGDAQITGQFSEAQASELANNLKFGALPVTLVAGDTEILSPSLGDDQLRSGLIAGGLGLIAVVLYSMLYYRALGLVTISSLLVSAALTYGAVCVLGKEIGFALSLAGIAGFIVSVGITADSFVVFFERLKDEIKEGRTPRSAVDRAWTRARRTILSADSVSFLAAFILYFVSVGGVRGFAFTLGLSTLLDVVTVFLFTRPLISLLSRYSWFSHTRLTGFHGPDGGEPSAGMVRRTLATPSGPATGPSTTTVEA